METLYFLGIDISKKKFNAALTLDGNNFHEAEVENSPTAIQSFFRALKKQISSLDKLIVCLEHTGIYGYPLLDFLVKNQIKVSVEPALQIKQSQGMTRGKNDQIDAKRIALYALKNRESLRFWQPQRDVMQQLKAFLILRERLVKTKVQLEVPINESEEFVSSSILKKIAANCKKSVLAIQNDIRRIEKEIDVLISSDELLTRQCKLATSVPGIGKITALNIIISTQEFSKIQDAKKFACYAGVAPFEHSSGSSIRDRTRVSKMANMTLKKLLHLSAMAAIQCSDELKMFYQRKVDAGKNKMSVLNAVHNKLISRIFACIKNNRAYQKIYQHVLA
jgi:transposase